MPLVPGVTTDYDVPVTIIVAVIPSAVQAAVVLIESYARAAIIAVAVVGAVAAHIDAEPAGAGGRGTADGERGQRGERIRQLTHCSSPLLLRGENERRSDSVAGNSKKLS
jgi:hypothetical protein